MQIEQVELLVPSRLHCRCPSIHSPLSDSRATDVGDVPIGAFGG